METDFHERLTALTRRVEDPSWAQICEIAEDTPRYYRHGELPKHGGGRRQIAEPKFELRFIQDWLVDNLWPHLPVHEAAHGYRTGRSIVTHAQVHAAPRLLLTTDVAKFFDAVRPTRVTELFLRMDVRFDTADLLARLCTLDGALPQGAPTSPGLANAVFFPVDRALEEVAWRCGQARYSRYVDDLALSWVEMPVPKGVYLQWAELLTMSVSAALGAAGFELNHAKTRCRWWFQQQVVTGLLVNAAPGAPPVRAPRERWRTLRAGVFNAERKGATPEHLEELQGLASFLAMTDPEKASPYLDRLGALRRFK